MAVVGRRGTGGQEREKQSACSARVAQPLGLTAALLAAPRLPAL